MKTTELLHNLGQSLWLDNITRDLLDSGTLERYIDELSVTGLTSNPTIFGHAIKTSTAYDDAIRDHADERTSAEDVFFDLALADIGRAADQEARSERIRELLERPARRDRVQAARAGPCWFGRGARQS